MRPEALDRERINQYSPKTLAFLGDCVYSLFARELLVAKGERRLGDYNEELKRVVSAAAQSAAYKALKETLTEDERAVMIRGRNANGGTRAKNAGMADYRRATGVEALFGWLWLTGGEARARELFGKAVGEGD